MYRITERETGRELEPQDSLYFVAMCENGTRQHVTDRRDAELLSIHGTLYRFVGGPEVVKMLPSDGVDEFPIVVISEEQAGPAIKSLEDTSGDHTEQIADVELAACEVAVSTEDRLAEIEQALCEIATLKEA